MLLFPCVHLCAVIDQRDIKHSKYIHKAISWTEYDLKYEIYQGLVERGLWKNICPIYHKSLPGGVHSTLPGGSV